MRIEQSRQELDYLLAEIDAWEQLRAHADRHGSHRSQLRNLSEILRVSLQAIVSCLDATSTIACTGEVYERCRQVDGQTMIVRRLWRFFAGKWDQRDSTELGQVLTAADEVIWSCWAAPMRAAGIADAVAPLPFVDPQFSPHATPRVKPPGEIRTSDDLLAAILSKLPIPLIGIPPICVRRPWWLVLLAHETGHHVAYDLLGEQGFADARHLVLDAAGPAGQHDGWPSWAHELFADAFAVVCVGEGHLWAIEELELAREERLATDAGPYPPALVRWRIGREALAGLTGIEPQASKQPSSESLRRLLDSTRPVARALVKLPLPGIDDPLDSLCDWRVTDSEEVARHREELLGKQDIIGSDTLKSARLAVAGSVQAWTSIAKQSNEQAREEARSRLSQRTLELLSSCREPGTRAAEQDRARTGAQEIAEMLIGSTVDF